ncbi:MULTISPECIES: helix-turn-helix domain-containing protein [Halopseudomonas]|uniref:Helix-turn-helix transcriptional regulator n=1 Tax=Halopseudomonas bauzanensis TaxID=653930 RepID=A0A4U0YG98_9GAMM|nr:MULTISPECIES: AraC family transcriptional regulator [Halopseudomonas]EZQ17298.1 AraC family transcriptional regulator [Halopseudomonas bauzanensis]TKA90125.1 helix-turn-helix transcriptional regulator [Halopseudomonas bauzanensis]WGK62851.1 AraC family transcriptional regulator [Halopseudomonas sp. SMJS2]
MNQSASVHFPSNNTPPQHPEWLKQSRQMLALLTETERAIHRDPDAAAAYLDQAIALLAPASNSEPSQRRARGGLARWQLARIDEFIKQHLDQCIRTSELASLLGLSVSHFSHAFKQTTGMTPLTYVAARRVEAAGQYMLCSGHSLSDIALVHGFCDQSHFCRVFRRETGLSPQTWRKLHTTNSEL